MSDETNNTIPYGFCHCGCGQKTTLAPQSSTEKGWVKGEPMKFVYGHHLKSPEHHPRWNGGKTLHKGKYLYIRMPEHPKANRHGYVFEHILLAEKALGKPLPPKAEVHHHGPASEQCLVICEDQAYHKLIEQRTNAWKACGNANWRKCCICKQYDDPKNLLPNNLSFFHRECRNRHHREYRRKRYALGKY